MKLTKNTLFNIAKHSNKTIKLADYMVQLNNPMYYNSIQKVDNNSDEIDLIEAFHKDLGDTATKIEDVHQLLSTVDADGNVLHLKGEKNLQTIFGDAYNKEMQTIKLPHGELNLKRDFDKEAERHKIAKNTIGLSLEQYTTLHKQRNTVFKHNAQELHDNNDKIEFLSTYTLRNHFEDAITKIRKMVDDNIQFRKALSVEEKNLIDEEITFTKSMVDGVTKASLYITKEDGIVQWGTGFKKKYSKEAEELLEALKENPYVEAIELDSNTDPKAFLSLMNEIKEMNFNLASPITLKSRKLGVYKANGLFYSGQNIVAVDVKNPSAALHEMIHAVDLLNFDIRSSKERFEFAKFARSRMDKDSLSLLSKKKQNYYYSTAEVIARAGEVSYLFEKFDYNPEKESFSEFKDRVVKEQDITNVYDLNIVSKIDHYTLHADIYFDIAGMNTSEVNTFREYYKKYYRPNIADKIENRHEIIIPEHKEHVVVNRSPNFQKTILSGIVPENAASIFEFNDELKIIDPDILVETIFSDTMNLSRTTKKISKELYPIQAQVITNISDWAYNKKDFYVMSRILEHTMKYYTETTSRNMLIIKHLEENENNTFKHNYLNNVEEFKNKSIPVYEEFIAKNKEQNDIDSQNPNHYSFMQSEAIRNINKQYNNEILQINKDLLLSGSSELFDLRKNGNAKDYYEAVDKQTREQQNRQGLSAYGKGRRFQGVLSMLTKTLKEDGNEILNYFQDEDIAPTAMIFSEPNQYQELISKSMTNLVPYKKTGAPEEYTREDYSFMKNINDLMLPVLKAQGKLEKLAEFDSKVDCKIINKHSLSYLNRNIHNDPEVKEYEFLLKSDEEIYRVRPTFSLSIDSVVFGNKLKNDISIEEIKSAIPDLDKYEICKKKIKSYKEEFNYQPEEITATEIENVLTQTEIESKFNLEDFITKKTPSKKEEPKTTISEEKKETNEPIEPIDPNVITETEETKKKRGRPRKNKIDPNQQRLF